MGTSFVFSFKHSPILDHFLRTVDNTFFLNLTSEIIDLNVHKFIHPFLLTASSL